jgi:hypothetical protein
MKKKGGRGAQNIDGRCTQMMYAPKNEDACENIKQENSEYRVEKLPRRRRSAIEDVRALEML